MAAEIENDEQEEQTEKVEKGTSKKLLFIIGGIASFVIIGALAFIFFYTAGSENANSGEAGRAASGPALGNAYYVVLPRPFIFNVPGQSRDRLVQISVQLMVRGGRNDDLARQNVPMIEGVLHRTFSSSTAENLQTREGRLALRDAALNVVQNALEELTGSPVVEELLFTGFVMQ